MTHPAPHGVGLNDSAALPTPEVLRARRLPGRVSPWRLNLDDSAIRPECRTPAMTTTVEVTLSRTDVHLVLVWLQLLEMHLITDAFCETLLPATLSHVLIQAYGGRRLERTDAEYTVDLSAHWAGGFQDVWQSTMDHPYSRAQLIEELRDRNLVPEGLGLRLLQGAEQDAAQWWAAADQQALPQHRHTWEAYFAHHGDTLEGWMHALQSQTSDES